MVTVPKLSAVTYMNVSAVLYTYKIVLNANCNIKMNKFHKDKKKKWVSVYTSIYSAVKSLPFLLVVLTAGVLLTSLTIP